MNSHRAPIFTGQGHITEVPTASNPFQRNFSTPSNLLLLPDQPLLICLLLCPPFWVEVLKKEVWRLEEFMVGAVGPEGKMWMKRKLRYRFEEHFFCLLLSAAPWPELYRDISTSLNENKRQRHVVCLHRDSSSQARVTSQKSQLPRNLSKEIPPHPTFTFLCLEVGATYSRSRQSRGENVTETPK